MPGPKVTDLCEAAAGDGRSCGRNCDVTEELFHGRKPRKLRTCNACSGSSQNRRVASLSMKYLSVELDVT